VGQLPLYYNYKPTGRSYGYVDMSGTPLFPFGHGLSYTEFEYSDLKIEGDERAGTFKVGLDVQNVGDREGDEVVQLYIHDVVASVARPVKELRGFKRLGLKQGEKKTITFALTPDELAFLDSDMKRVVEPGEFEVTVGSSSQDIRLRETILGKDKITTDFDCAEMKPDKTRVRSGESLAVAVKVKNTGPISDIAPVRLLVNGEEVASRRIDLSPGEEREVKFKLKLPRKGKQQLAIGLPQPKAARYIQVQPISKKKTQGTRS